MSKESELEDIQHFCNRMVESLKRGDIEHAKKCQKRLSLLTECFIEFNNHRKG